MTSIWDFSASQPSNNSAIPAGFPSGAAPSSVKTEFQYLMAFLTEGFHAIQATGTTEAFTASLTNVPASLTDGMQVAVRALGQNTTSTATFGLSTYSAHTITKLGGTALVSGDIAGANHELLLRYNLANTRWELLNPAQVSSSNVSGLLQQGQCYLSYTSATQLTLSPLNGSYVRIAGQEYSVPSSGVTLSNAGLAASTLYYIYLYNNSGTLTLEASTTTHATDTTAGNVGVEIKSGDNTRSFVGYAYTNSSTPGQFVDSVTSRTVISWFNPQPKLLTWSPSTSGFSTSGATTAFGSSATFIASSRAETVTCNWTGYGIQTTGATNEQGQISLQIDGSNQSGVASGSSSSAISNNYANMSGSSSFATSEGKHTAQMAGYTPSTNQWSYGLTSFITVLG